MRRSRMVMYWCALSLAGCATAEQDVGTPPTGDQPEERPMALLAEAIPEAGRTVKFLEAFEGTIVLGQTFPIGAQPLSLPEGMPVPKFFEQLAGKPAPQALVEAELRRQRVMAAAGTARPAQKQVRPAATATSPAGASNEAPDLLYAVDEAGLTAWFRQNFCWSNSVCDFFKTAPFERKKLDVIYTRTTACAYNGEQLLTGGYRVWWGNWTSMGYQHFKAGACASLQDLTFNVADFDYAASVRRDGNKPMGYHFYFDVTSS